MIPNSILGIHRGIIIANNDPEGMGRVKVFIPSINMAMFEQWFSNDSSASLSFNGLGQNLESCLTPELMEKLNTYLPWSEVAQPIFGMGTGGKYDAGSNSSYIDQSPASKCADGTTDPTNSNQKAGVEPNVISSDAAETRKRFDAEMQNPAVREKFYALMKAEVGSQGETAQLGFAETVFNRATVQNTSIDKIISNTKYYEPYQNGAFNRSKASLSSDNRAQYGSIISKVQGGSNITNGGTHNASGSVAASAKRGGYDANVNSVTTIGGETYYNKKYEKKLNFKPTSPEEAKNIQTQPTPTTDKPTSDSQTITEPPNFVSEDCNNTPSAPGSTFTDKIENRQNLPGGGKNNSMYPLSSDFNSSQQMMA